MRTSTIMNATIASTSIPVTMLPTMTGSPTPMVIQGYSRQNVGADYQNANGTQAPSVVFTLTPAPQAGKRSLSALEILLIATAVAVGIITLCLLLSVNKR